MNIPYLQQQFFDNTGAPLSSGKMYTYTAGSTTIPKPLYHDAGLTTPTANPLILDASGRPPKYYMTSGGYNFVLKDSIGQLIDTWDYQYGTGAGATPGSSDDHKVAVNGTDTQPGFLTDKLVPGSSIQIGTVNIPGLGLKTSITDDGRIRTNASDSTTAYIESKIQNSSTITWEVTGSTDKKLVATINDTFKSVIPVWAILKTTDPTTAPFGLSTLDLQHMYNRGYGVASSELQTTDPMPMTDLSIWYLEGGTYWGDATWVERGYLVGQAILNLNHGLYDYMTTLPEDPSYDWTYSNYPAGIYILANDTGDGYLWRMQVVKQYPDPDFSTDSVLTYNGFTKTFNWTATSAFEGEGTVKVQEADTPRYLEYKVQAGPGITVTNVYNGVYGNFLKISSSATNPSGGGYCPTMDYASAVDVVMPQLVGSQCELLVLFVPRTDFIVTSASILGVSMLQGASGVLSINIRDASSNYNLIVNGAQITNPSSNTFLESGINDIRDPITHASISTYTLKAGVRYYFSLHYSLNGVTYLGAVASQTTNISPLPAIRFDNLSYITDTLSGSGTESLMRPFVRIRNIGA